MAQRTVNVYSCDKCGKEIGIHRYGSNYVNDIWNCHWYDLCDDCKEIWDEYNSAMRKLSNEMNRLTEEGKWGIFMFEKGDEDGNI